MLNYETMHTASPLSSVLPLLDEPFGIYQGFEHFVQVSLPSFPQDLAKRYVELMLDKQDELSFLGLFDPLEPSQGFPSTADEARFLLEHFEMRANKGDEAPTLH